MTIPDPAKIAAALRERCPDMESLPDDLRGKAAFVVHGESILAEQIREELS